VYRHEFTIISSMEVLYEYIIMLDRAERISVYIRTGSPSYFVRAKRRNDEKNRARVGV